jgi:DNA-binding LacI/PurR family transcriptional regulator
VQVERALRERVAAGAFPGGRLPTEVDLAEQLGVSRETVRLAAEVLQREGLLVKIRRRGTFVRAAHPPVPPDEPVLKAVGYLQAGYTGRDEEEGVMRVVDGLMLQGAVEEAARAGIGLHVHHTLNTEAGRVLRQLAGPPVLQGVIFASFGEEKVLRRAVGLGLPVVLLDHSSPRLNLPSVREDSFAGTRQGVAHLLRLGHRRVAFVNWRQTDLNPWRLQGYRQALRDAGVPRRRAWELAVEVTPAGARQAVEQVLALAPRPTAVYCFNNTLAGLFIDTVRAAGLRVPEDLSVVGGGGDAVPGLTCHQADWHRLGRVAVQLLLRAGTGRRPPEHHLGSHTLQPGRTTAPPPPG